MNYRRFGRTNLMVSEIGHGLWGMGGWSGSNDNKSQDVLQKSLELGCNFYDSAWAYGNGHSDRLPDVFPRQHVIDYTESILENIGTAPLDLLQFHVWDDAWTEDDEWKQTISDLKAKKLIRFFGLSINRWQPWNGMKALQTGLVDAMQVIYNIFDQSPEDELFPLCEKMDIGVIARVPLDEGGLTGKLTDETRFPKADWRSRYFGPENLHNTVVRVEAIKILLPENMSLPEMALRFILSHTAVGTTIIGMRTLDHLYEDVKASDGEGLPGELIERLRAHRWDREVAPWSD
jgi:aryl-alcohol dehydrogenase-like predicted oxidoreductase